jgi:hypothetical protein
MAANAALDQHRDGLVDHLALRQAELVGQPLDGG